MGSLTSCNADKCSGGILEAALNAVNITQAQEPKTLYRTEALSLCVQYVVQIKCRITIK